MTPVFETFHGVYGNGYDVNYDWMFEAVHRQAIVEALMFDNQSCMLLSSSLPSNLSIQKSSLCFVNSSALLTMFRMTVFPCNTRER